MKMVMWRALCSFFGTTPGSGSEKGIISPGEGEAATDIGYPSGYINPYHVMIEPHAGALLNSH